MVENDLTAAAVQRQISAAAVEDEDAQNTEHLHAMAVNLVREVLVKANRHVHDYMLREDTQVESDGAALEREDTHVSQMSITRIENIAKEMVQSVTDQVTAMLEAEQLQEERPWDFRARDWRHLLIFIFSLSDLFHRFSSLLFYERRKREL